MNAIKLAHDFVEIIQKKHFTRRYNNEHDFEKCIYSLLRLYLSRRLKLSEEKLNEIVFTHGETPEEKKRWSSTKVWQDVQIAGCRNTSDIVIRLPNKDTIVIQIKYTKGNITGAIQTIVGQCLIASLRHSVVIGIVLSKRKYKIPAKDGLHRLIYILKSKNIFLVVK